VVVPVVLVVAVVLELSLLSPPPQPATAVRDSASTTPATKAFN
jgi:hypothetical protein